MLRRVEGLRPAGLRLDDARLVTEDDGDGQLVRFLWLGNLAVTS